MHIHNKSDIRAPFFAYMYANANFYAKSASEKLSGNFRTSDIIELIFDIDERRIFSHKTMLPIVNFRDNIRQKSLNSPKY